MMTDDDLIAGLQKNDEQAWEELVYMYYEKLVIFCGRYVRSNDEARDLVHDAFIKAKKKIMQFKKNRYGTLKPWLWQITKNTTLDYIKYRNRRDKRWQRPTLSESTATQSYMKIRDEEDGPRSEACKREEYKILFECLDQLDPIHSEIILLRYIDHFGRKEIASYLKIPENTVKSRLRVGFQKLRALIPESLL